MSAPLEIVLQFGLAPLLWAGIIFGLRQCLPQTHGDDTCEKAYLLAMAIALPVAVVAPMLSPFMPQTPLPLPDWSGHGVVDIPLNNAANTPKSAFNVLLAFTNGMLALYVAGVVLFAGRLALGLIRLFQIERQASRQADGIRMSPSHGISAIASLSGHIILSDALSEKLNQQEQQFILAHERAHLDRKDPLYFLFLSMFEALFWFNPFLLAQTERCRHAAELDCDARVIGKETKMRSVYASSLLHALKHTAGNARPCVPAAFSRQRKGDYRMRMELILRPKPSLGKTARYAVIGVLSCLTAPLLLSQISLAAPATEFVLNSLPVEGKITSTFGPRLDPISKKARHHDGMDIAAPTGTKVVAPCAGKVTRAEKLAGYGNLIEIDHGDGMVTRYGQLDSFAVKAGDKVTKGMKIGEVGMSGRATGPHLHFEVLQDGERKDPQSFLKK